MSEVKNELTLAWKACSDHAVNESYLLKWDAGSGQSLQLIAKSNDSTFIVELPSNTTARNFTFAAFTSSECGVSQPATFQYTRDYAPTKMACP